MRLIRVLLLISTAFLASAEVYYVLPDDFSKKYSSDCPVGVPSRNLSVTNVQEAAMSSDSIFYILPGTHYLNTSLHFMGNNLTLQGCGEMKEGPHESVMESPTQIVCSDQAGILFERCNDIVIANLTLINCSTSYSTLSFSSSTVNTTALAVYNSSNVTLRYMSIQSSPGAALEMNNVADIVLHFSSFFKSNLMVETTNKSNSSAVILTHNTGNTANSTAHLHVTNINITKNEGVGILTILSQTHYSVRALFCSVLATENSVANFAVILNTDLYDLEIDHLVSSGALIGFELLQIHNASQSDTAAVVPNISITNSVVSDNSLVGLYVSWSGPSRGRFQLSSTLIHRNAGGFGSGLQIANAHRQFSSNEIFLEAVLHNVTFDSNRINHAYTSIIGLTISFTATVSVFNFKRLNISNCTFSNNEGSGLALYNTYATFIGDNSFSNNTGYNGGGIFMITNSFIFLLPDTLLSFVNNHAIARGGAINVQQIVVTLTAAGNIQNVLTYCFYQFQNATKKYFYFENNTAGVAGTVLYGGLTSLCILDNIQTEGNLLTEISTFVNQPGLSVVSSDARGVCFCNENAIPDCSQTSLVRRAKPGGTIYFTLAVVGQHDNTTTGVISIVSGSRSTSQNVSSASCTALSYTVEVENSTQTTVNVHISVSNFETNFRQAPLLISVEIEPCLADFLLSNQSLICDCSSAVTSASTKCNAVEGIVTREGTNWLAYYNNCTLVYKQCPFDYCHLTPVTMSLTDPDMQCALNRSGLLCGQCAEGLSLMLGSNQCGECTNGYIALFIPFAVAGIALVFFLIALNLTVSVGTINGLLFFANIIKLLSPLSFGSENIPFWGQFISWVNLDLGIETCFFAGMDSCAKNGLQFIFPFYLWFLIFIIIVFSRWFSKVSKFIGNNAVPVLCTLLLLSYTKLLRTLVFAFSYATTSCTDVLWFFDANIPYFTGCHLGLFIFALLVLVVLFIPYTLFLLLFPLWELCRSKWSFGTALYLKLKPFFDAYAGPHNDYFRFWPGLLVLARVILAITIAVSTFTVALSMLVAIVTVLIVILSFGKIYKNSLHHILDMCFLLCILVIAYVIQGALSSNEGVFTYEEAMKGVAVMLSIAFLMFCGILLYHILSLPWAKKQFQKVKKEEKSPIIIDDILDSHDNPGMNASSTSTIPTRSVVVIPELREPLLESESYH